jgi:hypothetical protein
MCSHGDEVVLLVPVPANLSHTGKFRWDTKGVDRCIAPIVQALNNAGIYTASSCCGHGEENGNIDLHDGRTLVIVAPDKASI